MNKSVTGSRHSVNSSLVFVIRTALGSYQLRSAMDEKLILVKLNNFLKFAKRFSQDGMTGSFNLKTLLKLCILLLACISNSGMIFDL